MPPHDSWASYRRTVVDIRLLDGGSVRVRPAADADKTRWPWPTAEAVHLLTAWDPGPQRPGEAVNRARQAALDEELRRLALPFLRAVGTDPETGRWDEGVAVQGVPEPEALALASRYGQEAVFAWTPAEWTVVACHGGRRLVSGWSLARPAAAEFPFRPGFGEPMR